MASPRTVAKAKVAAVTAAVVALAVFAALVAVRWSTMPTAAERDGAVPDQAQDGPVVPGRAGECAGRALDAPRELRGMWLTTVYNIDWPSKQGLDQETVKAEYRGWLDLAQKLNHNAIFVQVRPSGDAFWPSAYAPWSDWLTGKRDGIAPGWDPMAYLVAEAHARNLEFHAWFNPYRGGQPAPQGAGGDPAQLAPNHPLRAHPDWMVEYPVATKGSRLYYNPGIPEARRFVEDSMLEAVSKYDIDGVHFDDFFYPYPEAGQDFNDTAAFTQYGKGFATKGDWRRDNVDKLVQEMGQRIKETKPWVKFGISPFGIWRNSVTDPTGSATKGLQAYDDIYADTKLWVKRQWVDYIVPQLYWNIGFDKADYAKLVPWWSDIVTGTRVQLYIGQADYRVGEAGAWKDPAELDRQLALNAKYRVSGSVHFSAKSLRTDTLGAVTRYRDAHNAGPALVPTMSQLPEAVPAAPVLAGARPDDSGAVTLTWRAGAGKATTSFAVYRVDNAISGGKAQLVATARRTDAAEQTWVDHTAAKAHSYAYCVTALDRTYNESAPTAPSS